MLPHVTAFYRIFGRTDLRISVSRAKFDAESDFEVRLAVARQKPDQNNEKLILRSKIFVEQNFRRFVFRRRKVLFDDFFGPEN